MAKHARPSPSSLHLLPGVVISLIFSFSCGRTYCATSRTSRAWCTLASHASSSPKELFVASSATTALEVKLYRRGHGRDARDHKSRDWPEGAIRNSLRGGSSYSFRADWLASRPSLVRLHPKRLIIEPALTPAALRTLHHLPKSLHSLTLTLPALSAAQDASYWKVQPLSALTNLAHLRLLGWRAVYTRSPVSLEGFSLPLLSLQIPTLIPQNVRHLPHSLTSLAFSHSELASEEEWRSVVSLPNLTALKCAKLWMPHTLWVATHASRLRVLDVCSISFITARENGDLFQLISQDQAVAALRRTGVARLQSKATAATTASARLSSTAAEESSRTSTLQVKEEDTSAQLAASTVVSGKKDVTDDDENDDAGTETEFVSKWVRKNWTRIASMVALSRLPLRNVSLRMNSTPSEPVWNPRTHLIGMCAMRCLAVIPSLRSLQIYANMLDTREQCDALLEITPRLETLRLYYTLKGRHAIDLAARVLSMHAPALTDLSMVGCTALGFDSMLLYSASTLTSLTALDLTLCHLLPNTCFPRLPSLRRLTLDGYEAPVICRLAPTLPLCFPSLCHLSVLNVRALRSLNRSECEREQALISALLPTRVRVQRLFDALSPQ